MGTPAFLTNGTRRRAADASPDRGRPRQHGVDDGRDRKSMGMLGVILPAADVLEIAKQAPEK